MTSAELQDAFKAYFNEIDNCILAKCHWSLLHLLVVIPDICGALESPDGESDPSRYESWCRRHLRTRSKLTPQEWYEMRCALLHQGRTRADKVRITFSFGQPSQNSPIVHDHFEADGAGGRIIRLDVSRMATAMKNAVVEWIQALQGPARGHVEANITLLARVKPVVVSPPFSFGGFGLTSTSTSS